MPWTPCPSEILLLFQQPSNTNGGVEERNPTPSYQLLQAAISLVKNVGPHLSVLCGPGLGFLGKSTLICWGFLSDSPSIVVHFPVYFSPSLICLQWLLCHFQRQRLPCVGEQKKKPKPALGCSPAWDVTLQQSLWFSLERCAPQPTFAKEGGSLGGIHLQPNKGLNILH